jgi:hypothetical protein
MHTLAASFIDFVGLPILELACRLFPKCQTRKAVSLDYLHYDAVSLKV